MHEAHWSYSFLSTQNTYLHFGLCTGVSLLVFHVHLSSSSCFSASSVSLSPSLYVSLLFVRPFPSRSPCPLFSISRFLLSLPRKPLFVLLALYPLSFSLALDSVFLCPASSLLGVSTLTRLHTGRSADPLASR